MVALSFKRTFEPIKSLLLPHFDEIVCCQGTFYRNVGVLLLFYFNATYNGDKPVYRQSLTASLDFILRFNFQIKQQDTTKSILI